MARIVAFIPDLLFGSKVLGALHAEGHEVELVTDPTARTDADVLIVDLTTDAAERIEAVTTLPRPPGVILAFYSHVESDVRDQARAAGFTLVVPRSRMAREGPALIASLTSD
jgi:hypothetical protein